MKSTGSLSRTRSWLARFEKSYLEAQRFFEPYPVELVELTDSGKGMETW
jgi:uncharacterized protein YbgA (DUF1722 family)